MSDLFHDIKQARNGQLVIITTETIASPLLEAELNQNKCSGIG